MMSVSASGNCRKLIVCLSKRALLNCSKSIILKMEIYSMKFQSDSSYKVSFCCIDRKRSG